MTRLPDNRDSDSGDALRAGGDGQVVNSETDRFKALLAASLDAAITMDTAGIIRDWNRAATILFGWTSSEAKGRSLAELLVPARNRIRLLKQLQAFVDSDDSVLVTRRFQTETLHRTGHEFPVEISIIPMPLEGTLLFTAFVRDIRDQLDEAEERGRLAAIVDSSTDAIIGKDLNGVITSWNAAAEHVYGYAADEMIGRSIAIVIPEDATEEELELREALTAGQTLQRFEAVRRRKDGQLIDVSISVSPMRNARGQIVGSATIERDITQERSNLLALEEREEQIRMLLESTAEAIYGVDLHGNCTFCNPSCARLLGYESPRTLIGQNMHELTHHHRADGSEYPASECPVLGTIDSHRGAHVDDEVLWRADGTCFPAEYWSFPIRRDGRVIGAVVTFLDISDRLAAEHDRFRLAALVESSVDPIVGLNLDGVIESWNDAALRVFGWTAGEAVGRPVDLLLAREFQEVVRTAIAGGRRFSQEEVRCLRKNAGEFSAALTLSPIHDLYDRHVGASIIARDMTTRKEHELALQKATVEAQSANKAKSAFLANISHELRTPMNAIIGMLELALSEELSEVMQDYLGTARDSAQTLLYLLNDLLDFSRIEAGHFELDAEPFSLRETLNRTARTLSLRAQQKGLELTCRIRPDVPDILNGDGMRLRQVVTNLVGNAIKFTDAGEVTIDAQIADAAECEATDAAIAANSQSNRPLVENAGTDVSAKAPAQTLLHFTVSDTGVGISPEDQDRIFAAFTQADTSSTRRFQGSGLGLAICRELITRMGGRIYVDSVPGQGSQFHFTARFPIVRQSVFDDAELRLAVAKLRDTRVLVVDDNASNCRILDETLKQWRMRPFVTDRADVALDELRRVRTVGDSYSVVLVDALMPEMDGLLLLEAARAENLVGDSAVLMLSSADRQSLRQRCEEVGVTRYLEKPVSQSDLLDAVTQVLRGARFEIEERTRMRSTSRPLRLLVAEDTLANQKVVRAILEKRGHEVVIADNGQHAVDLLNGSEFDVVLMDIQMPVMDGYRATRLIRQSSDPAVATIPIIAMTAHALREDMERCLTSGMNAYVSKPLQAAKLIRVTEETATRAHQLRTQKPYAEPGAESSAADAGLTPVPASCEEGVSDVATAEKPELLEDIWETQSTVDGEAALETASVCFDRKQALLRLGGDEQLLRELMKCFVEDAPTLLSELEKAISEARFDDATRAAHSLKSLAANFEAVLCRDAAAAMEHACGHSDREDVSTKTPRLRRHVEELISLLKSDPE
ncbi:PAS domain S-box protein [bacterium]|nr:PAS domain S-box protein [bacterium]